MTRRPTISTRPATLVPYTTLFRAFDRPEVSGLFNVGTGQARSFADLAAALFAALDRAPRIDYVDMPAPLRGRYQYFTEARMERLRAAGYRKPFTTLEDGVGRYVRDFLATPDPYRCAPQPPWPPPSPPR